MRINNSECDHGISLKKPCKECQSNVIDYLLNDLPERIIGGFKKNV